MQELPPMPQSQEPAAPATDAEGTAQRDAAAADQAERVPGPGELLREAELKAAEHHDAWLRAKAETENVRRRAQEDIAKAHKFAVEKFAKELLAVKDSLEAALATENATPDAMKAGVELTLKQLAGAFEKFGVEAIDPAGQKFDPHQHQAITMVETDG